MPKYDDDDKVITIFNRKKLRPAMEVSDRESGSVPDIVYFVMPDGKEVGVSTEYDIVIGRKPREEDPDVTIDLELYDGHDLGVSRHHAMIRRIKDNLILVDVASSNGTFVNGQRALPGNRYNLLDGDTLTVGRLSLELRFVPRNH